MGKVIACVNEKGGVAKTTTIKNLSIGLAMEGKKILAVDLDPSANLTKCLGLDPEDETGAICEIIGKMIECEELEEGYGITKHSEGIDVITSSLFLHQYESRLNAAFQREIVLRRYINTVKDNYDYIFLDTGYFRYQCFILCRCPDRAAAASVFICGSYAEPVRECSKGA